MNKIGWCSETWNPIHGCFHNCEYCYARKNAKRFWRVRAIREMEYVRDNFYIKGICSLETFQRGIENVSDKLERFSPVFLHHLFKRKFPKKSQRIFVGSMSEIYYWIDEWVEKVIEKTKQYPQHIFQFLTKFPEVYQKYDFPKNCWLGITTTDNSYDHIRYYDFRTSNTDNLKFISFEPLLEEVHIYLQGINWVIIGAESGNRIGKVIPKKDWVLDIIKYCDSKNIPIYIKDNLAKYYPDLKGEKQFPFDIS